MALGHAVHLTWPVLSTILAIQLALGLLVGFMETGLSATRSISPSSPASRLVTRTSYRGRRSRALAIGIGLSGLFLTGLIAGIAVHAMRTALTDDDTG